MNVTFGQETRLTSLIATILIINTQTKPTILNSPKFQFVTISSKKEIGEPLAKWI